ncbi:hypothetical protein J4E81_010012 [Alternaria sp. BMP 2799]|nr:hypothetical protein J4E81_010012 [Alternaria sp. BMP 2799]
MASFGFSIGDIVLVGNYAYSVYKSCKNAGDNFREITSDVASLRTLLLALDDECKNPQSSFQQLPLAQKGELAARLQDCKADLRSVKKILHDFRSLDKRDARYRDRLAFTTGKQAAIREKIATHSVRLQQLLTGINVGTFSRIERNTEAHYLSLLEIRAKLDRIHLDVLAGRRDATTFINSDDVVALEDEVLNDNMTEVDVDVSYEVHSWVERVYLETSQPLSMPDNDDAAIEDDDTSSSNSSDTCSVQEPSNTDSLRNDSHVRGDSPESSGDGSDTDEQNSRPEGVQKSLEAHKAPDGGVTPRFISDFEQQALIYQTSSKRANSSKSAEHEGTLIDLRNCQGSQRSHDSKSFEDIVISLQIKRGVLDKDRICYAVRTDPSQWDGTFLLFKIRHGILRAAGRVERKSEVLKEFTKSTPNMGIEQIKEIEVGI